MNVGCQDLYHFWLYTLVPHQADCPLWGAKPARFCYKGVGFVPHRLSIPTLMLYMPLVFLTIGEDPDNPQ